MSSIVERGKVSEHEQVVVPQIVAIDLDRTLLDSDAVMKRFSIIASQYGIDVEQIKKSQAKVEQDGGSFNPLVFIKNAHIPEEEFCQKFIASDNPPILYDDAQPFLDRLDARNVPYHILTYGVSSTWQELKLKAIGFHNNATILDKSEKGGEIIKWMRDDDKFAMIIGDKRYTADSVCLVDDKPNAFNSFPAGCTGFLLRRRDNLLPSQQGVFPKVVEIVNSLNELQIANGKLVKQSVVYKK